MSVVIDNFTVSIVSFVENTGADVLVDNPTVTLRITPNAGYAVEAANFSGVAPLPEHVLSIVFFQNGANVDCLVTFSSPFIMPDLDVFVPLCLQGSSTLAKYSINGVVNFNLDNTSIPISLPPPTPINYYNVGDFNDTVIVFTQAVVPLAGSYFPTEPTLVLTVGNAARYNITSIKTYNGSNQLIQINFTVSYKFGKSSVSGDILTLTASANNIYVPDIEITSYSINRGNIPTTGDSRTMIVYGNAGAGFSVDMNGTSLVTSTVMGSLGSYSFTIVFPPVAVYTLYTITLSGDLATPFVQTNPFTIEQFTDTQITFDANLGIDFTAITPITKSYAAFQSPPIGSNASNIDIIWDLIPNPPLISGSEIFIISQPILADWTNTDPLLNGGSAFYPSSIITLNTPPITGNLITGGFISDYGRDNIISTLDISAMLGIRGLPTLNTKLITGDSVTQATTGGDNLLDNGAPITIKGVEWSTSPDFITILGTTNDGSGSYPYDSLITGLIPGDTYYTRAYAINIVGTGYGQILPFVAVQPKNIPTIVTTAVTFPVDTTQALSGGDTINDDGQPITAKGIQWSTLIDFSTILGFTSNGTGNADYPSLMTGLIPGDIYYVRAYATSAVGTGYGNIITFSTSAYLPCGVQTSIPTGRMGIYQLQFDTGSAVGATVIYFDPVGVPDGIRILYDGVYYNALLGPTNGLKQSTSGVVDAFTITGEVGQTCQNAKIGTYSYPFFDGYDNTGWLPGSPSTKSITVAASDIKLGNAYQMNALVIPKLLPSPSLITLEVLGPCSGTGWNLSFNCPAALPSFMGHYNGTSTSCFAGNVEYYFAQKYAGTLAYPTINNWVFLDSNGQNVLPDGNYAMNNNMYITVVSGAVIATGNCT
jgi:hypothetical protein